MPDELPDWIAALPAINAALNSLATLCLAAAFIAIKKKRVHLHRNLMLTAFGISIAFLACYLTYHEGLRQYTGEAGRAFTGQGIIRPIYFTILISHIILAVTVPVLAIAAIYQAWRKNWSAHKSVVKYAFPVWMYVSVTGVVIYFMLYHWVGPAL
ncbi:DUF420 domain-containing protein [Stratiformator vulcanicus]|uniref:DUF420 domain-containing protein n=1 Tax=Stratiformator vulcanicus TaxID=2527980 RepID=A0A517R3Z0_9PLAN|nr:DUF420 domain-containing protein [Stratiformator vulcanicus]QDT38567.1 hypothetical protein Pan189_29620 [Stratiformator vulcanicus]